MADTYVALTRPENLDKGWPPKPGVPVQTDPAASHFVPAPEPTSNPDGAVIHQREEGSPPPSKNTVSSGSTEQYFTPNAGPISNDKAAGNVFIPKGLDPLRFRRHNNLAPPTPPVNTGKEVQFTAVGPAPIQNDPTRMIAHGPPRPEPLDPTKPLPPIVFGHHFALQPSSNHQPLQPPIPTTTVKNEQAEFSSAQPAPPQLDGVFIPEPQAGRPRNTVNIDDNVTFGAPAAAPPVNAEHDVRLGGGGDPTRQPRSEEVSIPGHPICGVCGQQLIVYAQGYMFCDHRPR